jgi:hypothetical protein
MPTMGPIITGKPTAMVPTKLPSATIMPPISATLPPSGPALPTASLPGGEAGIAPLPTMMMAENGRIGATMAPGI